MPKEREKVKCKTELEFITEVADDCVANLKDKDREHLIRNPYAIDYHFSYCLYIRNHYIHNRDFSDVDFWTEPDDLSSEIIRMIFAKLIPEYDYDNQFIENLFDDKRFIQLRQEYRAIYGDYPVAMVEEYKEGISFEPALFMSAFQMAVDDDVLHKNPFGFDLAGVVVNDSVTREALTRDQMRKFLKFVHDDNVYCKYYEVVYILFYTGMRISEFCGLTIKDVDLENRIVNIEHQLQRLSDMTLVIETTKTSAGTRKIPVTEDVAKCFQAIIEDREKPKVEKVVDGYTGFLFLDDKGLPLVAMHWEHRFNHMVKRYNDIYRVQMPNITPHVCRHTFCSNMAKSGMNPKTLQKIMGHSDIGVTLNTYTHLDFEDIQKEMKQVCDGEL